MLTLRILDSIADRGDPRADMEDTHGGNRHCAFVVDGASGLDGDFLEMGSSDAAWLARFAKDCFEELVTAERPVPDAVRILNERIARVVSEAVDIGPDETWRLPVAGFQLVRVEADRAVTYGLGDCRLFVVDAQGSTFDATALPHAERDEREGARQAIGELGGLSGLSRPEAKALVTTELRRRRAGYNLAQARIWTLGAQPRAADHVVSQAIPLGAPMRGLLCSDGFAALVDRYDRHDGASLVSKAADDGLVPLLAELRRIEQREDPEGLAFPRLKRSDDATAVLFEVV